jgi:hypothetical protein
MKLKFFFTKLKFTKQIPLLGHDIVLDDRTDWRIHDIPVVYLEKFSTAALSHNYEL